MSDTQAKQQSSVGTSKEPGIRFRIPSHHTNRESVARVGVLNIALGILLGNVLTGIIGGIVWFVVTH
jgi:hypothetical protein